MIRLTLANFLFQQIVLAAALLKIPLKRMIAEHKTKPASFLECMCLNSFKQ